MRVHREQWLAIALDVEAVQEDEWFDHLPDVPRAEDAGDRTVTAAC
jgi:hypothetical protein